MTRPPRPYRQWHAMCLDVDVFHAHFRIARTLDLLNQSLETT